VLLNQQKSRALNLGLIVMGAAGLSSSQTAQDRLAFEVASVKRSASSSGRFAMSGGPGTTDPGRISYTNIMLRRVLLAAYDFSNYQISGPDWLNTLRFDITAKVPDRATKEQFQSMLRNLLATRFQMTVHRESKELPIYALVTAKGGPKLRASVDEGVRPAEEQLPIVRPEEGKDGFPPVTLRTPGLIIETKNGRARLTAKDVPLSKLADWLSGRLDRPVVDMTGLAAHYSFALYFTPEGTSAADRSEPGIPAALQEQLGLRLEARRGTVEFLVIDHAEKVPTGN
jgi:uncharacterized protein (TIGR03435 family)